MQIVRRIEAENSALVGFGVRTMLIAGDASVSALSQRLAGLGAMVEVEADLFRGIERLLEDRDGFSLCVIDCDSFGGLELGRRLVPTLGDALAYVPVILLSSETAEQRFSDHYREPTILKLPLSPVAARVGFEHAMRDRFLLRAS